MEHRYTPSYGAPSHPVWDAAREGRSRFANISVSARERCHVGPVAVPAARSYGVAGVRRVGHEIRVALAEDRPVLRLGLRTLVSAEPGMTVTAEAAGAHEALAAAAGVDVVVHPLALAGASGPDLCRRLKELLPPPGVVVYASSAAEHDVAAAYLAGADGYVHESAAPEVLLDAVRRAAAGGRVWAATPVPPGPSAAAEEALTRREREVLGLLLQRRSNLEIADALVVGLPTVKTHVRGVLRKLGLARRGDLFRAPAVGSSFRDEARAAARR